MTTSHEVKVKVGNEMIKFTSPYLVQIFEIFEDENKDRGRYLGSGTAIGLGETPYLLTAAHVPCEAPSGKWAHSLGDGIQPEIIRNAWQCVGSPLDLALARLEKGPFDGGHRVRMLPSELFAENCDDLEGDLLFIQGVPGEFSKPLWELANGIVSRTLPYLTGLGESSRDWFDKSMHFSIDFRVEDQSDGKGSPAYVPSPKGMSGSAVWRTNWKYHQSNWRPEYARVVGVAFDLDESGHSITCTRIERIRNFINFWLHREAAYFHWQQRGCPLGDEETDWFAARSFTL